MNAFPYSANFIGATGEYPINEKIDLTSNTLNTKIDLTSNILNKKIDDTTNATLQTIAQVDNHYKLMIDEKIETQTVLGLTFNVKHTYIMNSNTNTSFGEIRFYNQMQSNFNINPLDPDPPPYKVKVATNGKLYLYYSYDPAIAATITGGWIDFNQLYGRLIADNINQGLTLAALQYEISSLAASASAAGAAVAIPDLGTGVPTASTIQATQSGLAANVYTVQSRIAATTGGGFAVVWGIGYAIFDAIKNNDLANAFIYQLKKNKQSNLDAGNTADANTIQTAIDYTSNNFFLSNLSNFNNNISNLSLAQGFLNSNIQTAQTLSNLNAYTITLNGQNVNNIFLAKNGGSMYNALAFQKSSSGPPAAGYFDGIGSRVILEPSTTTTDFACSMGINNSNKTMWNSLSSNYSYNWWIGGSNMASLSSNAFTLSNIAINAPSILQNNQTLATVAQNTILSSTPNVSKKYGFNFSCATAIFINSTIYYTYDIDLRNYTQTKTTSNPSSFYRIFNIKLFLSSAYFQVMVNNEYNVLSYEIYMSNEANTGTMGGTAGINIYANGTPRNPLLANILPTYFSLMRTSDFNYLTCISTVQNINISCIIQDLIF